MVRTPFSNETDITQGMPYSRHRIPRWLSGAPWSVTTPRMPALSAIVRNVVVPPRAITITSETSSPDVANAITSSGVSSHLTTPSTSSADS